MAPYRVFKYYKNIYCSKNLAENPEKFWLEYSNRLVGLGQVASLTKSGQEPYPRQITVKPQALHEAIEAARKAVVEAIQKAGDLLIKIGDQLLKDFPGLRDKFRKAIQDRVDAAVNSSILSLATAWASMAVVHQRAAAAVDWPQLVRCLRRSFAKAMVPRYMS